MKKLSVFLQVILLFLITANIYAADISIGNTLPDITINDLGLITFDYAIENGQMVGKEEFKPAYKAWSTSGLTGRVTILFHLAARMGSYKINKDFFDAIAEADFPDKLPDSPCKVIMIMNTDDALWGTSQIAMNRFSKVQQKFPYHLHIVDEKGIALKKWGLKEKDSAVIITDKSGAVVFFKEGQLNKTEIETALAKINQLLE